MFIDCMTGFDKVYRHKLRTILKRRYPLSFNRSYSEYVYGHKYTYSTQEM